MDHSTIGIDVSKARLDAHRNPRAGRRASPRPGRHPQPGQVDRRRARALRRLRAHRVLAPPLGGGPAAAGLPAAGANPLRARRFAEATGRLAKTDPVDAAMLADMAAAMDLRRAVAQTAALAGLRELVLAREQFVKDRTAPSTASDRPPSGCSGPSTGAAWTRPSGRSRPWTPRSARRWPPTPPWPARPRCCARSPASPRPPPPA